MSSLTVPLKEYSSGGSLCQKSEIRLPSYYSRRNFPPLISPLSRNIIRMEIDCPSTPLSLKHLPGYSVKENIIIIKGLFELLNLDDEIKNIPRNKQFISDEKTSWLEEAESLFGEIRPFSKEEAIEYEESISELFEDTGENIFD